jgi:hypothetical protein
MRPEALHHDLERRVRIQEKADGAEELAVGA